DRPSWEGNGRDSGQRDDRSRDREGGYGRDGAQRGAGGYRPGQDSTSRPSRLPFNRSGGADRPARGAGFSRTMADRIGGTFPDERAARPPRAGGDGRAGDRRPAAGGSGRPAAAGRPSGSSGGPRTDSYRDRRDDRRGSDADLPRIPDSITEDQLSRDVRDELGSLSLDRAITVGRYMVAAELASDPEQAYRYAQAAKRLAARVGIVREISGIMAYKSGRWAESLTELQAGRRMTGRNEYLPLMADAERGLGRLDRALDLVHSTEAKRLPRAAQIELRIVESGIRRDQGLADAAVLALQVPELTDGKQRPWSARLFYAYGEALLAAARPEAAREAFSRAVVADEDEQTDALARLDELDGISVQDLEDDDEDDESLDEVDDRADDEDDEDDDFGEDGYEDDLALEANANVAVPTKDDEDEADNDADLDAEANPDADLEAETVATPGDAGADLKAESVADPGDAAAAEGDDKVTAEAVKPARKPRKVAKKAVEAEAEAVADPADAGAVLKAETVADPGDATAAEGDGKVAAEAVKPARKPRKVTKKAVQAEISAQPEH
ncbi:MAG TPA: hypothetical protein VGD91_07700, partial [Trebonia sp.]